MTPAELIELAEKHNILIPNAFDKDSFEETSGWTDSKWERFIKYYGYDENDDAIMESIEYFEEQDEEEEEEEEEEEDQPVCKGCSSKVEEKSKDTGKWWDYCNKCYSEDQEEKEEKKVIVDPEKVWLIIDALERDLGLEPDGRSLWLMHGIPFDNIIVRGLTDRQLEVLGRFVSRCKRSD